jgi:hypothetical protein
MGEDAAHRAGLNAEDFTPYVSIAAMRDWAEVLGGRPVATSHPPHIGQAPRDVWNPGRCEPGSRPERAPCRRGPTHLSSKKKKRAREERAGYLA